MKNPDPNPTSQIIRHTRAMIAGLFVLLSFLWLPGASTAGGPTEQVRATVDRVLILIRSPNSKSKIQMDALRAQLVEVIHPRFDFGEMAKRSLGRHWAARSPEEQREFITLFAALMGRSFTDNIESYTSQNVLYIGEREDQSYAQVDTKIVAENRAPVSINYKLHNAAGEWKIYDLVIEDISVVNNYRSQFDRIIARFSFAELVRTMKSKAVVASEEKHSMPADERIRRTGGTEPDERSVKRLLQFAAVLVTTASGRKR